MTLNISQCRTKGTLALVSLTVPGIMDKIMAVVDLSNFTKE